MGFRSYFFKYGYEYCANGCFYELNCVIILKIYSGGYARMHSMTGYGKGVAKADGKTITIEIKSVNHRYLDLGIKMPRSFMFLEDSVKKYYAFYQLPCDEFSQTELDEYAVNAWPWTPKPRVRQGEEVLPPELFTGIGLESGVISYGGLYTLLVRLDFDVKGTAILLE